MNTARIYAFGDSITYGAWDSHGGWCDRLKSQLHQLKLNPNNKVKFQLFNLGIGGENSRSLLKRIEAEIKFRHRQDWPPIIIIATGGNDTRYLENEEAAISISEYANNLEKIIQIGQQYTDKILIVGLAPVEHDIQSFKNSFLNNALLKKYDQILIDLAKKHHLAKVDLFTIFKSSTDHLYSTDGVHPNDIGHQIIQKQVWAELKKILELN